MIRPMRLLFAASVLCTLASLPARAQSLNTYLSAPFTQAATASGTDAAGGYPNAATETFTGTTGSQTNLDSPALSVDTDTGLPITPTANFSASPVGAGFSINANGQYGGGLQGNYLGVPNGVPTTLNLSAPVGYLGLEWCAVDSGNSLTIYDQNNAVIGTFNAQTFAQVLPNTIGAQVTAIDGVKYDTVDYFGQPTGTTTTTGRLNGSQQYAFLNFITDPGTLISKVVFTEVGAVFELDNVAVLTSAPGPLGSFVPLGLVPEASSWSLVLATVGGLLICAKMRRRRGL